MPLRKLSMNSRVVTRAVTSRFKEGDFHESYTVQNELGRGRFAVVRKCTHKDGSKNYAAKFVRKRKMGRSCREDILKEIRILEMSTNHPRMIRLHEVFETSSEVILVLEFAAGGELHPYCVAEKEDAFTEQEVVRLVRQILEGVQYLHQNNIVHLDLKPQNILLTSGGPCLGDIKLIDFGIARLVQNGDDIRELVGTTEFVAPEVLNFEPITLATDMWSIGVVIYIMLTGISPFAADDKQETYLNISQVDLDFPDEFFADISEEAIDMIQRLCVKDPESRLTAHQCLNHPWLQERPTETTSSSRVIETENNNTLNLNPFREDVIQNGDEENNRCVDVSETKSHAQELVETCVSKFENYSEVITTSCNHSIEVLTCCATTTVTVRTDLSEDCVDGAKDSAEKRILDSDSEDSLTVELTEANLVSSEQSGSCRSPYHSPTATRRTILKNKENLPKDLNHAKRICIQVS
ncbi:serine/threonine-protein kinase 17A-like [Asterias rubens]|uniref:serine/threonine-protein kinase 17A-like n=1 Tax=Asterias rubens TaxID=7604 RepID=UPI001455CD41|nr:serine/threonine-protein kinase 17A-like [Asterias rubens]